MHTMERFRTCFYRPSLSSSENYERWLRNGARDANTRAGEIAAKRLAEYVAPPIGRRGARRAEEYVVRRRRERRRLSAPGRSGAAAARGRHGCSISPYLY